MSELIYTVGRRSIYDPLIDNDPSAAKRKGGSVWQTRIDAETYLLLAQAKYPELEWFSVYGAVAKWAVDTVPDSEGGAYHELVENAPLRKLDDFC